MAAEAEAAATKMAAEEAAAAAAAALEEAAAAAAAAAEERLLTEQEIANIRGLIVAANALVGTLANDSDDAAIAAAQAAVMAASDAVGNAVRLSDAQTAMYTSHVTVSGLRLAAAEANIQAARNLARAEDAEGDIQAVADAKTAVTDAIASLGAAQTAQSAAETALQTAQAAVTAAGNALGTTDDPDGEVVAYTSAQVAAAAAAADYAAKTTALTAAQAALGAANMNLAEIAPDASELASAQAALAAAITAADNAKTVADAAAAEQAKKITELEETVADLEKAERRPGCGGCRQGAHRHVEADRHGPSHRPPPMGPARRVSPVPPSRLTGRSAPRTSWPTRQGRPRSRAGRDSSPRMRRGPGRISSSLTPISTRRHRRLLRSQYLSADGD